MIAAKNFLPKEILSGRILKVNVFFFSLLRFKALQKNYLLTSVCLLCSHLLAIYYLKQLSYEIQDSGRVDGSCTHFSQNQTELQLNYRTIILITNGRLAEEKTCNQGFTEELVGRAEAWKGQALGPWAASEVLEEYLSCEGFLWEAWGLNPKAGSPVLNSRAGKRHPNLAVKSSRFLQ